jgi:hypothetical protein
MGFPLKFFVVTKLTPLRGSLKFIEFQIHTPMPGFEKSKGLQFW